MKELEEWQNAAKQSIIDTIKDKDCIVTEINWQDLSFDGIEQSMVIKYVVVVNNTKEDTFEHAMDIVK